MIVLFFSLSYVLLIYLSSLPPPASPLPGCGVPAKVKDSGSACLGVYLSSSTGDCEALGSPEILVHPSVSTGTTAPTYPLGLL